MKIGYRTPNLKKSLKARTTGKAKRTLKKAVDPLYGKKGIGYINDSKKAVYNKVYAKTTTDGLAPIKKAAQTTEIKKSSTSKSTAKSIPAQSNLNYKYENGKIIIGKNTYTVKQLKNYILWLAILGWVILVLSLCIMPIGIIFLVLSIILLCVSSQYGKILKDLAFHKSENIKKIHSTSKTNPFNEPLDKLIDGELPSGWYYQNKDFTEHLREQHQYFFDLWINSKEKSPKEYYSGLKSFILFLQDAQNLCISKGECYIKWFSDIIADEKYINDRLKELNDLKTNFSAIEKDYKIREKYLPTLQQDLFTVIQTSPGILQQDIYKQFPSEIKEDIQHTLYQLDKAGKIKREKEGRTYKLYAI